MADQPTIQPQTHPIVRADLIEAVKALPDDHKLKTAQPGERKSYLEIISEGPIGQKCFIEQPLYDVLFTE